MSYILDSIFIILQSVTCIQSSDDLKSHVHRGINSHENLKCHILAGIHCYDNTKSHI
jgi:hypothetical protein